MTTCPARAALAGNPSDGYGGAVVAIPIPMLSATVTIDASDRFGIDTIDPDLRRLLRATVDGFTESIADRTGARTTNPEIVVAASTTIPRSVGLAGSSALVVATLRALAILAEVPWEIIPMAQLALSIERDRLGIEAGLQDRLVQSAGRPVAMQFDPVAVRLVSLPADAAIFVAWRSDAAEDSGVVHRPLRRRFDDADPVVVSTMHALAAEGRLAASAIDAGDLEGLGRAMDRSFDLRVSMMPVAPSQHALVEIGRRAGAAMNSAGSGGSVVGLVTAIDRLVDVVDAYRSAGHGCVIVSDGS
ncbi:MAG: hypothetical protein ABIO83_06560 [Ilumatobacteraceae bacterium]